MADAFLTDLRLLGPEIDTFAPTPIPALSLLHMDPPGPVPGIGHGALLARLTPETLDGFLAIAATPRGETLLSAELRHLGGVLAPGCSEGGVVSGLDGAYLLFAVGVAPTAEAGAALTAAIDELLGAIAPWRSGADYLNFAERPVDAERLFGLSPVPLTMASVDTAPFGLGLPPLPGPIGQLRNRFLTWLLTGVVLRDVEAALDAALRECGVTGAHPRFLDTAAAFDAVFQLATEGMEYPRRELGERVEFVGPMAAAPGLAPRCRNRGTPSTPMRRSCT